jgi:flagellar P-ring protein precursor FlgI
MHREIRSRTLHRNGQQIVLAAITFGLVVCLLPGSFAVAQVEVRIKDLTDVKGEYAEFLSGVGLVAGLNGTGGKTPTTREYLGNLLQRFGNRLDPLQRTLLRNDMQNKTDNLSVVWVTTEMPANAQNGSKIPVQVAAMDDASSLRGGILLETPLTAVDTQVYAVAAGKVAVGGFNAEGQSASVQTNHLTSGSIPRGARIVKEIGRLPSGADGRIRLVLRDADFDTASRIAEAINGQLPGVARVFDSLCVDLFVPPDHRMNPTRFISLVRSLKITPDVEARVVIDESTGTIVIGENVRLSRVALMHGNLTIITSESPMVSQPAPFSEGETTVVPRTELDVVEERRPISVIEPTTTVGDLAAALNALGATPLDLSAILQQLRKVGALHAEIRME